MLGKTAGTVRAAVDNGRTDPKAVRSRHKPECVSSIERFSRWRSFAGRQRDDGARARDDGARARDDGPDLATSAAPASSEPTDSSSAASPSVVAAVTVKAHVAVTIPLVTAAVTFAAPVDWAIDTIDARGISLTGCLGLGTSTVRCLNVTVGPTLDVTAHGPDASGATLQVVSIGLGGGPHDYPLS